MIAVVRSTSRVVEMVKQLRDGRWLCTDYEQECHPCYNEEELLVIDEGGIISLKEALTMLFDRQKRGVGDGSTLESSMDGLKCLATKTRKAD